MTQYEKLIKIDNSREIDAPREKNERIEMSDKDHREKLQEMLKSTACFVKLNSTTNLVNNGEVGIIVTKEKQGKKNERKKSKTPKKATTKNDTKPDPTAVENI